MPLFAVWPCALEPERPVARLAELPTDAAAGCVPAAIGGAPGASAALALRLPVERSSPTPAAISVNVLRRGIVNLQICRVTTH
jgi:hypothetical protein